MSSDTVWTRRSPGQHVSLAHDPETGATTSELVISDFTAIDHVRIPEDTPHPSEASARHPFAGQRLRISRSFYSIDPTGSGDRLVAHVWVEKAGLGIAETRGGFKVYELPRQPSELTYAERWEALGLPRQRERLA